MPVTQRHAAPATTVTRKFSGEQEPAAAADLVCGFERNAILALGGAVLITSAILCAQYLVYVWVLRPAQQDTDGELPLLAGSGY
jgi:hypothetical protein